MSHIGMMPFSALIPRMSVCMNQGQVPFPGFPRAHFCSLRMNIQEATSRRFSSKQSINHKRSLGHKRSLLLWTSFLAKYGSFKVFVGNSRNQSDLIGQTRVTISLTWYCIPLAKILFRMFSSTFTKESGYQFPFSYNLVRSGFKFMLSLINKLGSASLSVFWNNMLSKTRSTCSVIKTNQ